MQKLFIWGAIGFAILILLILGVALYSRSKKSPATSGSNGQGTITIWSPIDEEADYLELIKRFEEANPTIKVKFVKKPLEDYEKESLNAMSDGKGPDVWLIPNNSITRHLDKLTPAPDTILKIDRKDNRTLTQLIKETYVPIVAEENMKDGKLYSLPLFVDTLMLYVNPKLLINRATDFERQNISFKSDLFYVGPKNWQELVDLVKLYTTKSGNQLNKPAIALGRAENVEHAQDILAALMMQNGAIMATPDGLTATFNLPSSKQTSQPYYPGTAALKFFASFSNPSAPNYTWNQSQQSSSNAFRDEQVAMIIDYASLAKRYAQEKPTLKYNVLPLPQIEGAKNPVDFASYYTLSVPKTSKNPDAAWNFIQFLSTTGLRTYLANTGRPNPLLQPGTPQSITQRLEQGRPTLFQQQSAVSWYRGKDPDRVETIFLEMISKVTNSNVDPQNAINSAAEQVSKILRAREGFTTTPSTEPQKLPE